MQSPLKLEAVWVEGVGKKAIDVEKFSIPQKAKGRLEEASERITELGLD